MDRSRLRRPATRVLCGLAVLGLATLLAAPGASAATSATRTITANWTSFFSGKTSATRKIALVQDGSGFASVIRAQSDSVLAKGASAVVLGVTVHGSTATVRYTVDLDGVAALRDEKGTAIRSNGTWKVSAASFCVLLGLEQVKTKACPAASAN